MIYWEHLGMLQRPSLPSQVGDEARPVPSERRATAFGGWPSHGRFITTEDRADGSISSADVEALVDATSVSAKRQRARRGANAVLQRGPQVQVLRVDLRVRLEASEHEAFDRRQPELQVYVARPNGS